MNNNINKFYRKQPIKEFDLNQTMYSLVWNESKNDLNLNATGFMGNNISYRELFKTSDKLAQAFYESGVREGDSVAILTIGMPLVEECLLSLSKIGAQMVWIDLRTKEKDLIKYLNSSNCKTVVVFDKLVPLVHSIIDKTDVKKVIVASPKDYLNPFVKVLAELRDKKEGTSIILPNDKRFIRFNKFIQKSVTDLIPPVKFEKDRPSLIVQSSGSTGKPKQIIHTEYNFNSAVQKMAYTDLPFYKGNTMHISIPTFIIYGLGNSIYASLAFTMKAELNPYVEEYTVYNDLGKFDISLAAPLHYRYIYSQLIKLNEEIDNLKNDNSIEAKRELKSKLKELSRVLTGLERAKVFVSGGDKIGEDELLEMEHLFNTPIINGYGNNECLGATIVSPLFANKPGSIGIPMYGVETKIIDPITGKEMKQGEIGELYISSDNLFVEYLNNPEETNKIKEIDKNKKEWVKTGDLALIDKDGYIYHKGRNRRLIKKEAFKISPDTIEDIINSLPFVKECVVVGVNDKKSLSVPMAFITLKNDKILFENVIDEIKKKCIEELPDYEVPTYFEYIDKIPYTPNDKQDFRKLEQLGNDIVEAETKKLTLK